MKITHMMTDFCFLESLKVTGYPEMTISRGKVIVENGKFIGRQGDGKFLKRKIDFDDARTVR